MPTAKAGAQCRVPVPSPPPRHGGRRGRWGQARLVGAGETGGGRRGWWGQARPMGAVSLRPYARARQRQTLGKPPGQIPSQHSPFGPRLSRRNRTKETNKSLRSSSKFQIPLNPNPKKIQTYSVNPTGIQINSANPNTQSETKEIQSPTRDPIRV